MRRAKWKRQSIHPVLKTVAEHNEETWDEDSFSGKKKLPSQCHMHNNKAQQQHSNDDAQQQLGRLEDEAVRYFMIKDQTERLETNKDVVPCKNWSEQILTTCELGKDVSVLIKKEEGESAEEAVHTLSSEMITKRATLALQRSREHLQRHGHRIESSLCLLKTLGIQSSRSVRIEPSLSHIRGAHPNPGRVRQPSAGSNYYFSSSQ
mmetsp:Transcript_45080/g.77986  ORF Transcript_45080/g.77986 Transcript_45080/m.77986 type:complete len:206 (-) Transcript_45080:120-737(-)